MSDDMGNDLREAEAKLEGLTVERLDIQNRLGEAIEAGDADAIIRLERRASEIDIELFAARAKVLKLRRSEAERLRREAITERESLEAELVKATKHYAEAVIVADERRVVMQTAQLKNYSCQSRIDTLREDYNELNNELKTLVSSRINKGE
jgi:Mg2+ and Co2+ transporter CorA